MGVFDQLKEALETQRERGCETTPAAKDFVENYDDHVRNAAKQLRERQARDREQGR